MLRFEGTKTEIVHQWTKEYMESMKEYDEQEFSEEDFGDLFDLLRLHIGDDELFMLKNRGDKLKNKLISSEGQYYISIKNGTWVLCLILLNFKKGSALTNTLAIFAKKYFNGKLNGPVLKKLYSTLGESCIMLEARKNKNKGIHKDYLKKYKGECINNFLTCNYCEDGRCKCTTQDIIKICEKLEEQGLLAKKENIYFYQDVL